MRADMQSGIELLMRVANGDRVAPAEALRLLTVAAEADNHMQALGLDRVARVKIRDAALVEASRLLSADRAGAWAVAGRLAQAIERFQSRVWPRLRAGRIGAELDPLDRALHRAFLSGERVPATPRRLFDLLK